MLYVAQPAKRKVDGSAARARRAKSCKCSAGATRRRVRQRQLAHGAYLARIAGSAHLNFECSGGRAELASVKTREDLQEHHDRAGERMHKVARSCAKEHLPTVTALEGA